MGNDFKRKDLLKPGNNINKNMMEELEEKLNIHIPLLDGCNHSHPIMLPRKNSLTFFHVCHSNFVNRGWQIRVPFLGYYVSIEIRFQIKF